MTTSSPCDNGADLLVKTLLSERLDVCFANPGTSEMHMVAALDRHPGLRCVLVLFEGVATGAADGYARMAGRPAATLLHLGPGFANGMANLHNARKAGSPILNIVGDHAVHHLQYDAPLTSDLEGMARCVSHWVGRADSADRVGDLVRQALGATAGHPGRIATLLMAANAAWTPVQKASSSSGSVAQDATAFDAAQVEQAAALLRRRAASGMLLIGGSTLCAEGIRLAAAITSRLGCRLAGQSSSRRTARGGGLPHVPRVPYPVDQALAFLHGIDGMVCVGAPVPVAFFAYPDKPSLLVPDGCEVISPVAEGVDPLRVLRALADSLGVTAAQSPFLAGQRPARPQGALQHETVAAAIASTLPDHAIVVDEAVTTGRMQSYDLCAGAGPHDWINNMGGSIGYGLPVALGASVACPQRRVIALVGDGSAFYTDQALWSMAREGCDITVVIYANRSYAILQGEWRNMGAGSPGRSARDLLNLDRPEPDWCAIAKGHGMAAVRVHDAAQFADALARANVTPGPTLIEAMID